MAKRAPRTLMLANGDRNMPGGWRIAGYLIGGLVAIAWAWIIWITPMVMSGDLRIAHAKEELRGDLVAEAEKRSDGQRKTETAVQELKGAVQVLQEQTKNLNEKIGDIKTGQEKTQTSIEKVLDEIRAKGRTR